ncbi:t-SNARE [Mycotypha africana]|uniref:t-SNARE n=1 Tax=Mycotypha africana TaxID=64632 RepID=UPI002301ECE8|nr:t-SNARE [Mycotypha africana]KAI8970391.1 t-SNARE [Mycotypha africana]
MTSIPMNPREEEEEEDFYGRRRNNRTAGPATVVPMEEDGPPPLSTTAGFFDQIDRIKIGLNSINTNVDHIGNLHNAALETFNEQQSRQLANDLESMKQETQSINNDIKQSIRQLEAFNSQLPNDSETQMRRSQTAAIKKRFLDTIQRYQDVERNYQLKYRQRIERQIRIVKPEATEDEIDDIIDADDTPQIFAQSLVSASRQGQSKAVLSEVQKRHDDIRHIEKTIVELHQLFMDMQMMVEQQGEVLNTAEQHADETVMNVKEGNTNLSKAILLAKSTRAKKWCCFFICIAICVMIAILVWWFGFGHPVSLFFDHPWCVASTAKLTDFIVLLS